MKLIIFDWDGTLCDSIGNIILCKKELAKQENLSLASEETMIDCIGLPLQKALSRTFPSAINIGDLTNKFIALSEKYVSKEIMFKEAQHLLEHYHQKGYKLAIASSKKEKLLTLALKNNKILHFFDIVCSSTNFSDKPNPEMLHHILNTLDISKDDTYMIGDTIADIETARNARVTSVAISHGAHKKEKLRLHKPDFLVNNLNDIKEIIA